MPLIKSVSMTVDGSKVAKELPDVRTVVVKGKLKEHFLYTIESLLAMDTSGYYGAIDGKASYRDLDGEHYLLFRDGSSGIRSMDKVCQTTGVVPSTHVIRYTGDDIKFRSFYMEQGLSSYSSVYTDMRKYSHAITDAQWCRLIMLVDNLLGFEFVVFEDGALRFNPQDGMPLSAEAQKFIYMIMAECYLTPPNYKRVLLLSDIPYLDNQMQIKLFKRLGELPGFGITLTTADIGFTDIQERDSISFLNL